MQYVYNLTRFTRLGVTSHSQPIINAKHKFQVTHYLQTIFQTITNEPIGLIILITSWLTINIAPFTLGQMNIIRQLTLSLLEGISGWRGFFDNPVLPELLEVQGEGNLQ
jgi:hypothetical protein